MRLHAIATVLLAIPLASAAEPWVVPADAAAVANPVPATPAAIAAGKASYVQNCQICHGAGGAGDGAGAAALVPKPASLKDPAVSSQSDGALFWKLSTGRGMMLGWKLVIADDAQRWQLVDYMRTLAPAPAPAATPAPAK